MHIYIYLWVLLVQDRVTALLRFIGSVSNLSLLTVGGYYYYYNSRDKMMEKKLWPRRYMVWVLVGVVSCVPRPRGIAWLHCFPYLCRLRTIRCIDPDQVTDLLSRTHTRLWKWEGLLLFCHRLRLFLDRLIGGGDRWRSKHQFEAEPQVWGLGVQVSTGTWNPW
jgi:hypothetical protein